MGKKKKSSNTIIIAVIFTVAGFFAGQFLHIPALNDYNLFGAMHAPSAHHRER